MRFKILCPKAIKPLACLMRPEVYRRKSPDFRQMSAPYMNDKTDPQTDEVSAEEGPV